VEDDPETLARASAKLGKQLRGKYVLDRVLGIGGMATVYAATHRNAKRFAVKMLHPELSKNEDVRARFLREGYVANKIEHPGAVDVLDDDTTDDGEAFLVMELLEGCTVEQMADAVGGRLEMKPTLAMAHQLLDVLASAHDMSIVHRDIKPANLFVLPDGTLKVFDFGIARLRDATSQAATGASVLGTPAFMAPEQAISAAEVDGRTDIYAVGATIFMLVSGEPVHFGSTPQEQIIIAATTQAPSLASVVPDAHPAIVAVVDKALAFAKKDRWESAAAMRDAIAAAAKEAFGALPSPKTLASHVSRATGPKARALQSQATVLGPETSPEPPRKPTGKRAT
jgi:serine/threonine-protein kinase